MHAIILIVLLDMFFAELKAFAKLKAIIISYIPIAYIFWVLLEPCMHSDLCGPFGPIHLIDSHPSLLMKEYQLGHTVRNDQSTV